MRKDKGCIVLGKDLKNLLICSTGVLIFEGKDIHYIPIEDPICRVLTNVCRKIKGKKVFISSEFDKVQRLEDNKEYLITLGNLGLEVWNKDKSKFILNIDGVIH